MFIPPPFRMTSGSETAEFIASHRFASIVMNGPDGPVAAHVPMLVEVDDKGEVSALVGHVARANPFAALAGAGHRALAIFQGADAYVSPGWYPSKAEHGRAVPTWNYMAVEASGPITMFEERQGLLDVVTRLSDVMETGSDAPWSVDAAPRAFIDGLLNAISGIRIQVDKIEGKAKLSQNKPEFDHAGVVSGLAASSQNGAQAIAQAMTINRKG